MSSVIIPELSFEIFDRLLILVSPTTPAYIADTIKYISPEFAVLQQCQNNRVSVSVKSLKNAVAKAERMPLVLCSRWRWLLKIDDHLTIDTTNL
jgi:hypothetical protein